MTPLERCIQTAKEYGAPRDQVERFLLIGYIPLPWQWHFHSIARQADYDNGPVDIGLGGARGPGKSHAVLAQVALDDCQRVSGLKVLFLRQTGNAAQESFNDLVLKVVHGKVEYRSSQNILRLGDNCRIVMGGFQDEKDIDKYIGIEYDIIIVEELNQLTEDKHTKIRGSLRTSKPNWRPRMYTSFNPGGRGHAFVKNRYVTPFRKKQETETRFIPSTYLSNPHLNKEYIQFLEGLSGDLGKAWREGEWDLFAGQYFTEFRYSKHVITPFVPHGEVIVGGMDWGYSNPFAFYLSVVEKVFYRDEKSDTHSFYRTKTFFEAYGKEKDAALWSKLIKERLAVGYSLTLSDISWVNADSAIKDSDDGSTSVKDQFIQEDDRWRLLKMVTKGPGSRIAGWQIMHRWLSLAPDGMPYWQITENCSNLTTSLPELIHDENVVEDVESDRKGSIDDDAADATRYMLKGVKLIEGKTGQISKPTTEPEGNRGKFWGSNENMGHHVVDLGKFK